jgi:exosortase A-associated hydrolase 1
MRRLLTLDCQGAALGASLDGEGSIGLLFVTGGTQTRIGSHRLFERLASALAEEGIACFRFDRRGVGDSAGADPGWRASGPDIAAAASAFRRESPGLTRIFGFGLCDGASALALNDAGLSGLILVNPWLVEAESGEPAAAAVKDHYRRQLASLAGWKRLLSGSISFRKLLKGLGRIAAPAPTALPAEAAAAIERRRIPVQLILARGDATAIAAEAEWRKPAFRHLRQSEADPIFVESDSHTFARPGDFEALRRACLESIERLSGRD